MSKITELEKEILALPPAERERLALAAWESLVSDPKAAAIAKSIPRASNSPYNAIRKSNLAKFNPSITPSSFGAPVALLNDCSVSSAHYLRSQQRYFIL